MNLKTSLFSNGIAVVACTIAALAALTLVAGSVASAKGPLVEQRFITPVGPTTASSDPTSVTGGTPSARASVEAVIARLGRPQELVAADIDSPPDGYAAAPQFGAAGTAWLTVTVRALESGPGSVRALWVAALLAGGYRQLAKETGNAGLLGYSTRILYPDGTEHTSGGLIASPIPDGQELSAVDRATAADRLLSQTRFAIETAVAKGASIDEATVSAFASSTRGFAAVIDARLRGPDIASTLRTLRQELGPVLSSADASYLVVRDDTGAVLYAYGSSTMTNEGIVSGSPGIVRSPTSYSS